MRVASASLKPDLAYLRLAAAISSGSVAAGEGMKDFSEMVAVDSPLKEVLITVLPDTSTADGG
jgi:hypothetical protein